MKNFLSGVLFLSMMTCGARELFLPPTLYRKTAVEYERQDYFKETTENIEASVIAFGASAWRAFVDGKSEPLATLIFGQESFALQQAFASGAVATPSNPFLSLQVYPKASWYSGGALFSLQVRRPYKTRVQFGVRGLIPLQYVMMQNRSATCNNPTPLGGQNSSVGFLFDNEVVEGIPVKSFAFRMDLMSRLPADCQVTNIALVNYADPMVSGDISIVGQDITNNPILLNALQNPVFVTRTAGTSPSIPYAQPMATVQALPCLNNNGTELSSDQSAIFCNGTTYIPLQSAPFLDQLWLEPSVDTIDGGLATPAAVIRDRVSDLLGCLGSDAESVFTECGLDFKSHQHAGLGDARLEFFLQGVCSRRMHIEPAFILLAPTATYHSKGRHVFDIGLGNNGHWGVGAAVQLNLTDTKWVTWQLYAAHLWILPGWEKITAPFAGAMVKNLGPQIPARISWSYDQLESWLTLHHHWGRKFAAVTLGYQAYHKEKDWIRLCATEQTDCLGVTNMLDPKVARHGTGVVAHTLWLEGEYRRYGQRFTSAVTLRVSDVVAGDWAPNELTVLLGFTLYKE